MTEIIFYILESIGILAFAVSGIITAKTNNDYDSVGVYIIALATAFGGGTIRDLILDKQPIYWISHPEYPLIILIITLFSSYFFNFKFKEKWLFYPDSLGLALFTVTAAQTAYVLNFPIIIIAILATISATFGSILRDILCNKKPLLFHKDTTLYATVSFIGACFFVFLTSTTTLTLSNSAILSFLFTFSFRIIANKYNLKIK
tara:strand:- start:533 stop:1141 length:609 start_codon:yes stop_codon:yes gene_type:complete